MITSKDIDEIKTLIEELKTEQRKVNNILSVAIDELEKRVDKLELEKPKDTNKTVNYEAQQRRKNMEKYFNTITCGPSAFKAKDVNYAED